IDSANPDTWLFDSSPGECFMASGNRTLNETRLNFGDSIDKSYVSGYVNNAQLRGGQHHGHFFNARQVRKHLSVAGEKMSSSMQRFFVERSGADRLRAAIGCHVCRDLDVLVRSITGDRGELAPW